MAFHFKRVVVIFVLLVLLVGCGETELVTPAGAPIGAPTSKLTDSAEPSSTPSPTPTATPQPQGSQLTIPRGQAPSLMGLLRKVSGKMP